MVIALLLCCARPSAWGGITIVDRGVAESVIVLGSGATANDVMAADELAKYLKAISGAKVPIKKRTNKPVAGEVTIFVGNNRYLKRSGVTVESAHEDAFIVKTKGMKMIVLLGNGSRGTLYSVYALLEELGCRWFMPGSLGEIVPSSKTLVVEEMDLVEVPDFSMRNFTGDGDLPDLSPEDETSCKKWMLRNRFNRGFGTGFTRFNAFPGDGGHAYDDLIPGSLFETKPWLFPLIDGQRVGHGQRCVANPEAANVAEAHLADIFKNDDLVIQSVSPNDNWRWCECQACVAKDGPDQEILGPSGPVRSYSGRVFGFANQMADRMRQSYPGKFATVYAYQDYSVPPTGFQPRENLIVKVTHNFSACDAHSIGSACEANTWFRKNVVEKWEDTRANLWFHGYTYRWKAIEMPYPTYFILQSDVRDLRDRGFWGYHAMAGRLNWGSNGLSYYVLSRLLWDADVDVNALIDDYCDKMYGPSATAMKNYFYFMAEAFSRDATDGQQAGYQDHLINTSGLDLDFAEQFLAIYTPAELEIGSGYLEAALAGAASDNKRRRIEIVRYAHRYAMLFRDYLEARVARQADETPETIQAALDAALAVRDFLTDAYVPWSIALKTGPYGALETIERRIERLEKK